MMQTAKGHEPLQLGPKLKIWPPVVLAPMAGVTNYPYRKICSRLGAGLCVSEMVSSRGILEGHRGTWKWFISPSPSAPAPSRYSVVTRLPWESQPGDSRTSSMLTI